MQALPTRQMPEPHRRLPICLNWVIAPVTDPQPSKAVCTQPTRGRRNREGKKETRPGIGLLPFPPPHIVATSGSVPHEGPGTLVRDSEIDR
jgi:hypothetical protein